MTSAFQNSVGIAAYLALFAVTGFVFVFVNLLLGYFLRPSNPNDEKLEIYECGEPTIGSSFVQFDLRFYVVALIFIVFDVEVAFLFPWATVFGKADVLRSLEKDQIVQVAEDGTLAFTPYAEGLYQELGIRQPQLPPGDANAVTTAVQEGGFDLLWLATVEVVVFFAILLLGFAYEWRVGALDWVRALTSEFREQKSVNVLAIGDAEPALSA